MQLSQQEKFNWEKKTFIHRNQIWVQKFISNDSISALWQEELESHNKKYKNTN